MTNDDSAAHLEQVRRRFHEINGDHPMTEADDAYVRQHFVEASAESLALMASGHLPAASYLLSDGTPMVPADHGDIIEAAGGADDLYDWFIEWWRDEDVAEAEAEWPHYLSGQYVCLKSPGPQQIRDKARWSRRAEDALARLEAGDAAARVPLSEAVAKLDALLLPQTAYDRLRFDGAESVRERLVEAARRTHLGPNPPALPIRTDRLTLRLYEPSDFSRAYETNGDPEVAAYLLHEPFSRSEVADRIRMSMKRNDFRGEAGSLLLVIDDGDHYCGYVALFAADGQPETAELGWTLHPDAVGKGYATEAARAMLDVAFGHYGLHRVFANLDARNGPSQRLCERLGMRREQATKQDWWSKGEWTDSFNYALLRSEWQVSTS